MNSGTLHNEADLSAVIDQIESVDRTRADLVARRDQLIHELLPVLNAVNLSELTGLSTTGIYKISARYAKEIAADTLHREPA